MLQNVFGFIAHPRQQWMQLRSNSGQTTSEAFVRYLVLIALIPPIAVAVGSSQIGWPASDGSHFTLSLNVAVPLAIMFYILLLSCVLGIAWIMNRILAFYEGESDYDRCLVFTIITSVPLFLSGFAGFVPLLWVDIAVVLMAGCLSTYLLYTGIPIFLGVVAQERKVMSFVILIFAFITLAACLGITLSMTVLV